MKKYHTNYRQINGVLIFLILSLTILASPVSAQTIGIRSAAVAPGDTVTLPVEISEDVQGIYGFQFDMQVIPSAGAPDLTIDKMTKGTAVTTAPDLDSNPPLPVAAGSVRIRIGLPTEIPAFGIPRPDFNGPGSMVNLEFTAPASAETGQSYQLILNNVILAGPDNMAIPLTLSGGTLTVSDTTAVANAIVPPGPLILEEGQVESLIFTVTGAGQPIPGVALQFSIDNSVIASLNLSTAVTTADGKASVSVTGLRDGDTTIGASATGLDSGTVNLTVQGVSPYITSSPPLEVNEGAIYSYRVEATDPNGDTLTYSLSEAPATMTIDANTISWTPPQGQPQTGNDVTVEVNDPDGNLDSQSFSIYIVIDADGDTYDNRVDCNDNDRDVNPGMPEITGNGQDDDCDPATSDTPPVADFGFDPPVAVPGAAVQFTDRSSALAGRIESWRWDFGDGAISTGQNPVHSYQSIATFTVTLTVTDDRGAMNSITKQVKVAAPPAAAFAPSKGMNVAQLEDGARLVGSSGGANPEYAIDSGTSYWRSDYGETTNQWIKVELTGETTHVIDRVKLQGYYAGFTSNVKDFEIRVATTGTDDADFTTVFSGTVLQEDRLQEFTFAPVTAGYVQLVVVTNWGDSGYATANNFQVLTRDREGGIVSLLEGEAMASIAGSSGWAGNFFPENMIDDDPATTWYSPNNETTDQWVKVRLGGGNIFTISKVRLQSRSENYGVKDFDILVSTTTDENSAFTTVFSGTASNTTDLQEFSFAPSQARYLQLFVRNNYGGRNILVSTFQALTPDGANAARPEGVGSFVVDYSSQNSESYSPAKAIDFDRTYFWRTANGRTTNQWFKILLREGGIYRIDRIRLQGANSQRGPKNFEIRVSRTTPEDRNFVTIFSGVLPRDDNPHWFTFPAAEAKYVQLYIHDNHGDLAYIDLADFRVYATHLGGSTVPLDDKSVDPDGDIAAWHWDFGDGSSSTEQHPLHIYAAPGTYTIRLTVTDHDGLTGAATLDYTVLKAPEIDFDWSPEIPGEGEYITFNGDDTGTAGNIVHWEWQFAGAAYNIYSHEVTSRFKDNGEYSVTLTATNSHLLATTVEKVVSVVNLPPTVQIESDKTLIWGIDWNISGSAGDPGKGDQSTLVCDWNFGDGQTDRIVDCYYGAMVPHIYASPGNYIATLTVTDKDGASTSASANINIIRRDSRLNILSGVDSGDSGEVLVTARLMDYYNMGSYAVYHTDAPPPSLAVAGRTVIFDFGLQTVTAVTDNDGIAGAALNVPAGSQDRLSASFDSDQFYNGDIDEDIPFRQGDVLAGIGEGMIYHLDHAGNLLEVLDSYNPRGLRGGETTGMCFDSANNMYSTNFNAWTMSKFTKRGGLLVYPWGSSQSQTFFRFPESCVVDADDHIYAGEINDYGSEHLRKFDLEGNLLVKFRPVSEDRGIDWIDLSADQCTMFYSSEGSTIKRYDVCTDEQLPDFATGLNRPCFALRIRSNEEVITACGSEVYRLSAAGDVIQTYPRSNYNDEGTFFAMNLDPDGESFWTALYYPGKIYRIDIKTGALLTSFEVDAYPSLAGLAVYGEETAARNLPPVADAGPDQTVTAGTVVSLNGAGSADPNTSQTITFRWLQVGGPSVTLSDTDAATPTSTVVNPGEYTFELTVSDGRLSDTDTVVITVGAAPNDPPLADANGPYTVNEGTALTLDGSGSTDPNGDPLTFSWDFDNDGQYDDASGVSPNFAGIDDGVFPVRLKVTDSLLDATAGTTVTVKNVAPSVEAGPDQIVNEGATVHFSGSFTDPGTQDAHSIEWNFGDGNTAGGTLTPTNVYPQNGVYTVTMTVIDDDGGVGSDTAILTVKNVAPLVDAGPDAAIDEGDTFISTSSFTDPGADTWTATVDYGDGSGPQPLALNPDKTFALNHVYVDDGAYTVTVTVTDDDGGGAIDTAIVTVNNVPPTVDGGPDATIDEGGTFVSAGSFTDVLDTHTATVDYGDGSGVQTLALNPDGTFALSHVYADDGVYIVTVTVTDDDGGEGSDTATVTVNPVCIIDLKARPKAGKVQIVWTPENDAESYNVYRSTTAPAEIIAANRIAEGHVTDYATYLDTNVVNGTAYHYKVTKIVGGDEVCVSNEASATPQARTRNR